MRYPLAEWVPWAYRAPDASPTYFKDQCTPSAVVLHIMQGYATTARQWAQGGHYGASWHFTVARDGSVMQHLELTDGGYQAGLDPSLPDAVWPLWRGRGINVNLYTLGIEHEGFSGEPFTAEQAAASKALCQWLSESCGIPFDRDHFPPHADIDITNRPSDFNTPALREAHYAYLLEDDMTPADEARIREIATDTIAAQFRALVDAYFTGGFTEPDGTSLPVEPAVAAAIASIAKGTPTTHVHSFGPTTTGPAV